jgi:anti-sigma factor RsiW
MSEPIAARHLHLAQWQERLQDAVDQALSPAEMLQVQAHLTACPICTTAHQQLLAVDQRLRNEFAAPPMPSAHFEQRLFANIAAVELSKRNEARQSEQQAFEVRMARLRGGWRELAHFHLGNVIGCIATVAAVGTAVVSMWPNLTSQVSTELASAEQLAWLPHGWASFLPTTVIASAAIAVAAIWITRRLDSRPT